MRYKGMKVFHAPDMRCCNSCYARNYDDSEAAAGERVERIIQIQAGQSVITLCEKCAAELAEKIKTVLAE